MQNVISLSIVTVYVHDQVLNFNCKLYIKVLLIFHGKKPISGPWQPTNKSCAEITYAMSQILDKRVYCCNLYPSTACFTEISCNCISKQSVWTKTTFHLKPKINQIDRFSMNIIWIHWRTRGFVTLTCIQQSCHNRQYHHFNNYVYTARSSC